MSAQPADLAARLREAAAAKPQPMGDCAGRGIVICAGGSRLFTCAWLLIAMLRRKFQCDLPIEVWHIGPAEMGPPMRALLEALEVTVIDALKVSRQHPVETLGGWQLKTYAMMHSRFREILLLDADNLPVRDPAFLFDDQEFADKGALFWPDIVRLKASNPIWTISGLPVDSGATFETGQLLIDKERQWPALTFANWINQNHVAFDHMLYGDKDACYVAWRMLGSPYSLIGHATKLLEHTFLQRAPDGAILFQHRNGAKWTLNGPNPRIEGFRFESECLELLVELRRLWDGTIFNPPARSAAGLAMEQHLIALARFRLIWRDSHESIVTLRAQHLIEGGNPKSERYWFVADGAEGLELRLVAHGVLSCALRCDTDAIWRGNAGELIVELHPEVADFARVSDTSAASSQALMAIANRLLDGNDVPSAQFADDIAITLATLATLDEALVPYLERCAAGRFGGSSIARATLTRYRSSPRAEGAVRSGTGWLVRPDNLTEQSEALPKR